MRLHIGRARRETRESLGATTEMALGFVLWCLRERGVVPWLSRRGMLAAARLLHLSAGGAAPGWKALGPVQEYCELAGIDPVSGRVVDWERFYEAMERSNAEHARKPWHRSEA